MTGRVVRQTADVGEPVPATELAGPRWDRDKTTIMFRISKMMKICSLSIPKTGVKGLGLTTTWCRGTYIEPWRAGKDLIQNHDVL